MIIGITGLQGWLGDKLAKDLAEFDHEIISLDKWTRQHLSAELSDLPERLDWVLHLAAHTSISKSLEKPLDTYINNSSSTLTALKIAHSCHAAFLLMSSYVYGLPRYHPIDEEHPLSATNPYMSSKIIAERICQEVCETLSMPLLILRPFNLYGSGQHGRLISDMFEDLLKNRALQLNDAEPVRDYLYVKDFCSLLRKMLSCSPLKAGVYNVGSGENYSNLEVAQCIQGLGGSAQEICIAEKRRGGDILDCSMTPNLVKSTFSWQPEYSLEAGLGEMFTNIRKQGS